MLISDKHSLNLQYFAFNATIFHGHWQLGLVNVQGRFRGTIFALAGLSIFKTIKMITAHPAERVVKQTGDVAKEKVRSDAKTKIEAQLINAAMTVPAIGILAEND